MVETEIAVDAAPSAVFAVLREQPESGPGHLVWSLGGRLLTAPMLRIRNDSSLRRLKEVVEGG